jgi:GxxExxY protein
MNRGDAEAQRINEITEKVIGACIEIHRQLGPGLLESAYEECLCYDLSLLRLGFERQKNLPVAYKAIRLACGYKIDIVVENLVVVELKAVEKLLPVHEAQLLTYLKLSGLSVGLLINFNVAALRQGIKRIVNNFSEISAPPRLRGSIEFST